MKPYFQDDAVTIYHGDCREVLPELSADIVITDPPYNAGKNYGPGTDDRRGLGVVVIGRMFGCHYTTVVKGVHRIEAERRAGITETAHDLEALSREA